MRFARYRLSVVCAPRVDTIGGVHNKNSQSSDTPFYECRGLMWHRHSCLCPIESRSPSCRARHTSRLCHIAPDNR
jgi:hypothetical protein